MSLVENMARRSRSSIELLQAISELKERGYSVDQIAAKTGLSDEWVRNISLLLEQGEERLITAVERGTMPLSIAMQIARGSDEDARTLLSEAYEQEHLTGQQINSVRHIINARQSLGKALPAPGKKRGQNVDDLLKLLREQANRQRMMAKKSELVSARLAFVISALNTLMSEPHFLTLLRAEGLTTMPLYLVQKMNESRRPQ